jgi:hypothetical protein
MKNWLKQNLVLAMGLALPVLLIVLFFVATVLPKSFGTPPQYELLFTTTQYDYQNKPDYVIDFNVKNKQLMVKAKKIEDKNNYSANIKKLMLYDAKTETLREIAIEQGKLSDGVEVLLEETKSMEIDSTNVSPDGYTLEGPNYGNSGLLGGLFGGGYRNAGFRLKKGSVGYKVPNAQPDYYNNQMQFVGWVIKK